MKILFNDPAEYYFVCSECYYQFAHMQWAGSTRGIGNWRKRAEEELAKHESIGAPCEFCGPHGNGGWMIDGKFPAAEKRDRLYGKQSEDPTEDAMEDLL